MRLYSGDECIAVPLLDSTKIASMKKSIATVGHTYCNQILLTTDQQKQLTINPKLDSNQVQSLKQVLNRNIKAFAWELKDIGKCNTGKFHLDTGDSQPIAVRFQRRSHFENQIISKQVNEFLAAGIIEKSRSPWAANALVVPKKADNQGKVTWRMVVSYKKLNSVTKLDKFPMPK